MPKCVNPYCTYPTSKYQTIDGKSVNYVHWSGQEFILCPLCIKKTALSIAGNQNIKDRNEAAKARDYLRRMAIDETVLFKGEDESYAELRVR
jgi:hypothetical protein